MRQMICLLPTLGWGKDKLLSILQNNRNSNLANRLVVSYTFTLPEDCFVFLNAICTGNNRFSLLLRQSISNMLRYFYPFHSSEYLVKKCILCKDNKSWSFQNHMVNQLAIWKKKNTELSKDKHCKWWIMKIVYISLRNYVRDKKL